MKRLFIDKIDNGYLLVWGCQEVQEYYKTIDEVLETIKNFLEQEESND